MKTAVELKDVVKRFGDFTAVDHISLEVYPGEIFGFLGPNGAGKSTTIRMICGLLIPTSGQGHVQDLDIISQSEEIKANIGYMSQRFSLYDDLRVEENLSFFGGVYGLSGRKRSQRIEEVLNLISLADRRNSMTWELPVGHKQRLALGCAILHDPRVLFLDEPTSGVDPRTRRNFWDLIYALSDEGVTVFVTTHFMEEAEYCDRVALINEGRLIAIGSPNHLKQEKLSGRIYDIETSDVLSAVDILSKEDGVREAAIFGRSLHVRLAGEAETEAETEAYLSSILASAGQEIKSIRPIDPTLEDVFVALVGQGREDQG
ncbi:MAG: ABC transporter ATP-binding protein [Deltaproteobacteria bacterium]|nr:ABC transporter ATP-binding protein [Deltaproteobacteria bacterium]MBW2052156.1 ABC transporter ATP-binding protein [Deltaproteobacteria bacterium]MBW2140572.1 ABC transporter ATP-binding protein [Deltaproteobacteria bacterium]MBW2323871.1 ABC transporter ATP-binding protein [Deltaproteobacteria bacterium]